MIQTLRHSTKEVLSEILAEMQVRKVKEFFLLFAMGSRFDHLIAQALAKLGVFCIVADPATVTAEDVGFLMPHGIIVSGGPASVATEPPPFDNRIFDLGIPTLGICLGFQMWAKHIGVNVYPGRKKEFGIHMMHLQSDSHHTPLFKGFQAVVQVLHSHGDEVMSNAKMDILGYTASTVAAASYRHLYGVQFHPEVTETSEGPRIFENFCFEICGATSRFPARDIAKEKVLALREKIGDKRVLLALSGGSDSSVVAQLLKVAIGDESKQIRAVYIKGIDRPDDEKFVRKYFGNDPLLELVVVDATHRFLEALQGKHSMHEKRVTMRGVYKEVLEEQARDFKADFIAQGTLYTDISESGGGPQSGARKAQIKLHHNTDLNFSLPELTPLDDCVKDGARGIGRELGVHEELLVRHPFPGPGLIVRIEGEITPPKLVMARAADGIWIEEIRNGGYYEKVWQAGTIVSNSLHTISKGDDAGVGPVVRLRAVSSANGFTARAIEFPLGFLPYVVQRITNEVPGVGAVDYCYSDKPPSTIECG